MLPAVRQHPPGGGQQRASTRHLKVLGRSTNAHRVSSTLPTLAFFESCVCPLQTLAHRGFRHQLSRARKCCYRVQSISTACDCHGWDARSSLETINLLREKSAEDRGFEDNSAITPSEHSHPRQVGGLDLLAVTRSGGGNHASRYTEMCPWTTKRISKRSSSNQI
jgi:hypothetical protein